eukprot:747773-Hanusia_phi.AAC.2
MLSTRASGLCQAFSSSLTLASPGTNAVRYGTMRENALGLQAVMADGSIISTGSRARKSSTGYDLTRLLIGESLANSSDVLPELRVQSGIPVARIELLDEKTCAAIKTHRQASCCTPVVVEIMGQQQAGA